MKALIVTLLAVSICGFGLTGCAPEDEGGEYKAPDRGEYKAAEDVPERAGRQKAESGSAGSAGRSEGG